MIENPGEKKEVWKAFQEDLAKELIARRKEKKKAEQKAKTRAMIREKAGSVFLLVFFLSLFILFAVIIKKAGIFESTAIWFSGRVQPGDRMVEKEVGNLWRIREAVDRFYAENRLFPDNMEELYGKGFLSGTESCPISGKKYIMERRGTEKIIRCPNPGLHGVSGLWVAVKDGPPVVERDGKDDR
ncbi:MAG: hypothetical protein ABH883_03125 [Candidatus Omnitrophota bacterium]